MPFHDAATFLTTVVPFYSSLTVVLLSKFFGNIRYFQP